MAVVPEGERVKCQNCGTGFLRPVGSMAVECSFCAELGEQSLIRKIKRGGDTCRSSLDVTSTVTPPGP